MVGKRSPGQGAKWQTIRSESDCRYLENKYRVLLTRAREKTVIWVPEGKSDDPTLSPGEGQGEKATKPQTRRKIAKHVRAAGEKEGKAVKMLEAAQKVPSGDAGWKA